MITGAGNVTQGKDEKVLKILVRQYIANTPFGELCTDRRVIFKTDVK
jgi:hypothetical protein